MARKAKVEEAPAVAEVVTTTKIFSPEVTLFLIKVLDAAVELRLSMSAVTSAEAVGAAVAAVQSIIQPDAPAAAPAPAVAPVVASVAPAVTPTEPAAPAKPAVTPADLRAALQGCLNRNGGMPSNAAAALQPYFKLSEVPADKLTEYIAKLEAA